MARHDEALFVEFVHVRSPALYRTACLLVGDRALAEDLLQQALVQLYARWGWPAGTCIGGVLCADHPRSVIDFVATTSSLEV